jgi:hypothetical protein
MPLAGKYLKYSPGITLEIFTLVWNKLIDSGINAQQGNNSVKREYAFFSDKFSFLRLESTGLFGAYTKNCGCKETTVQEILGYDPFIKNDFVLPEKWCIKRNDSRINEWLNKNNSSGSTYEALCNDYAHVPGIRGYHLFGHIQNGYTEITFDQFKKYVLKETIEQSKSIEKWSVGSYAVALKDGVNWGMTQKGDIYFIDKWDKAVNLTQNSIELYFKAPYPKYKFKWFATKSEAEEFAKTLLNPIEDTIECETCNGEGQVMVAKLYPSGHTEVNETCTDCNGDGIIDKPKQPLKQAVHCTTQEEWDFVSYKMENEVKSNQEFRVGDWVLAVGNIPEYKQPTVGRLDKFSTGKNYDSKVSFYRSTRYLLIWSNIIRHATPEEVNQHLISIGQIPAGEPLNNGIEPNKDGIFKYKSTLPGSSWSGGTIDNHLDVMIQSKTQSEIEFNYLPEPK